MEHWSDRQLDEAAHVFCQPFSGADADPEAWTADAVRRCFDDFCEDSRVPRGQRNRLWHEFVTHRLPDRLLDDEAPSRPAHETDEAR